jgi:Zn-dependent metalloprotease
MDELKNILGQIQEIDYQIKNKNELYKKRNDLEDKAIQIIENNNLKNSPLKLGSFRYQYSEMSQKETITQTYLKSKIYDYYIQKLGNEDMAKSQTHDIMKFILDNRTSNHKSYLKVTSV